MVNPARLIDVIRPGGKGSHGKTRRLHAEGRPNKKQTA